MFTGLLLISLASLLFQLSLIKIFSVIIFSNYAFMIISTALFGFGLSGVFCSVFPGIKERITSEKGFAICAVLFAFAVQISFFIINNLPLQLAEIHKPAQMIVLGIYYLTLITPFFFSGLVIVLIFSKHGQIASKLYFFDLFGAALGCLCIIPLFKTFGGAGAFCVVSILGLWASLILNNFKHKSITVFSTLLLVILSILLPRIEQIPVKVHDFKRTYKMDQKNNNIEFSKWSALSKIDVAITKGIGWKRLWIDGGTNESALVEFDGRFHEHRVNELNRLLIAVPYIIKDNPDVIIIGSSGGREVLMALNNDPASIDAIEMDPTICQIVSETYSNYIGNIFHDPRVNLICDEGRSYIKRSTKKYDIIHQINNFTPIAMASGAINVSESYLLTMEAFEDYWDHLKEDGYLVFNRHNTFKIAILAQEFLKRKNKDASRHLFLIEGEDKLNNGIYIKKSPFNAREITELKQLAFDRNCEILYSHDIIDPSNWYFRLLKNNETSHFLKLKGFNLSVPTDNRPFFEHIEDLGQADISDPETPEGLKWIHNTKKLGNRISSADLTFLVLIIEASLLSVLFIFLPLFFQKNALKKQKGFIGVLSYFFSIGFSYIIIELCLIQIFVLFLGVPIFSISTVIFSLLSASGIGSYASGIFKKELQKKVLYLSFSLFFIILVYLFSLNPVLNHFLKNPFWIRVLLTFVLIFPLGFIMGMFFPLGIKLSYEKMPELIPWNWGMNSYATVIGSVLGVCLAIYFSFSFIFMLAALIYLTGSTSLYYSLKNRNLCS